MWTPCTWPGLAHQTQKLIQEVALQAVPTDEHSGTMNVSRHVESEHYSFNLQQMDAVFHEVVMRRLRSPVGYEALGKNKPPLKVEQSSFSDYVQSLKVVG